MKKICILLCVGLSSLITYGQNVKIIAVVATSSDIDKTELHIIEDDFQRELLNASDNLYDIRIGKSDEFFAERNAEMNFQHSGAVDEEQVKEYGKLMGVEQLCVIVVERRKAYDYYFRAKIYDVETGRLRKTASYPDSFEGDESVTNITDYYALQRANRYLISRIGILGSARQSKWDEKLKAYDDAKVKGKKDNKNKANSRALISSIVPGLGLMNKGYTAEGVGYLLGDIALVGGGVGMILYANKQKSIMEDRTTDYDSYNQARSAYNSARTTSYICFGCAGVVYVINLVRAYTAVPKRGSKLDYGFITMPVNTYEGMQPGVGLALTYNF